MAFVEDASPFFADFGVEATVGGFACVGIFDNAYASAFSFTAGTSPTLLIKAGDAPTAGQGDAVDVAGTSYTIASAEKDGTGMLLLRLDEV